MNKNVEKLFTNSESNNIISRKYNPLKANICEREGLPMKEKYVVVNEEMRKLIISKEDFKNYFNEKKIISRDEYKKYLENKKQ